MEQKKPHRIWVLNPDTDVGEVIWTSDEEVEAIRDLSESTEYVRADLYDNVMKELNLTREHLEKLRSCVEREA